MELLSKCYKCRDKNSNDNYWHTVYAKNRNKAKAIHVKSMYDDATYITTLCICDKDYDVLLYENKREFRYNILNIIAYKQWRIELNDLKEKYPDKLCRIWSGQWSSWWLSNYQGYTNKLEHAGIYNVSEAYEAIYHCGIEKKIKLQLI